MSLNLKRTGVLESGEETPLLSDGNSPRKETPLPITQILVLLLLQLADPITSSSIRPYINQLVSELPVTGGDERKVGYYTGLIVSLYFAAQAITTLQWSRLSDKVGRKPVLLCGLLGTIISSLLFGLSRSFWALVFSRGLNGVLNEYIGVMKSMLAELTDETNEARGCSLISVTWAVGGTVGSFIGGMLSRPQDRWPNAFSHTFWGKYPYFLPCLATVLFAVAAIFLKETVNSNPAMKYNPEDIGEGEILDGPAKDTDKPLPLRALLTRPVVISVANFGVIGLLDVIGGTLVPLVWSTSVEFGGLGMSPASSAAPNKRSLGATNGIAQTMISIQRTVGPAAAASLFAFSLDNNVLG